MSPIVIVASKQGRFDIGANSRDRNDDEAGLRETDAKDGPTLADSLPALASRAFFQGNCQHKHVIIAAHTTGHRLLRPPHFLPERGGLSGNDGLHGTRHKWHSRSKSAENFGKCDRDTWNVICGCVRGVEIFTVPSRSAPVARAPDWLRFPQDLFFHPAPVSLCRTLQNLNHGYDLYT